ncbi:mitochondrial carrier protein MTM1 isoform X2 [Phoenix dactylifera]|uniref:Mitochondrial carrier protein MTM1 isoform X2 n=1 Tax=Phoenix dactylifera TaxID=42345 RepID=A0A8B7BRD7_PHODC|nr:mitochondrial carrier protein MTM1 isoform X2 [Phoenix dactylifera]
MPTSEASSSSFSSSSPYRLSSSDADLGFGERAFSAAGAAVLSAILVNPLDVAKTRLQAQAAGVPYDLSQQHAIRCYPSCNPGGIHGSGSVCPPDCFQYRGTLDVFYKVIRQVGIYLPCYDILRNWIEEFTTHSSPNLTPYAPLVAGSISRSLACLACSPIELARTRMQAFKESRTGARPPGMWRTLLGVLSPHRSTNYIGNLQGYRVLWTGVGAQLARDVPFSAICWSTLEPTRRSLLGLVGEEGNAASVLGANFLAGFVAGSLAAAATCPLDVAKTRCQIEKDPAKVLKMTTRQTLAEIWRKEGVKGLFTGVRPRVGRAGPSVGIVVSFYEIVKHVLHRRHSNS